MPHYGRGQHDDVPRAEVAVAMAAGLELFRLDGRVALLTGGGGAIGSAVAAGLRLLLVPPS